ncbi:hypothetical protein Nepgr_012525 [Nepenthes gracilis]|uniref:t-SNARE coiled-coil homology domain-containing protein n=1 Tax=Nepenthes gracilis TaxID=150966 RepID=A0AAD3SHF3_NEPGR|nr:hypothetical protein Nepgr_012525 [Nepenthes gracilis]
MKDLMTKSFMSYVDLKKAAVNDLEHGLEMGNADAQMELFLEEAEKVKAEMGLIREILGTPEATNEESKSLHKPDDLRSLRNKVNADIVTVLRKARTIKSQLEEMENRRLSARNPIDRTRTCVTNGLLKELTMDFQELHQQMMAQGYYPDEDMLEKIIASGVGEKEILAEAIKEHGRGKVVRTVVEIKDRHNAAQEVERSLLDLHRVFLHMAVLVEARVEQMDDIEHHVMNGGNNRSSRKWICVGIIPLLLIAIPIFTSFTKS